MFKFTRHSLVIRFLFFSGLILFWAFIAYLKIYPNYLLPSPLEVLKTINFGFFEGDYFIALGSSFRRVLVGYLMAVSIGLITGLGIARFKYLSDSIGACLTALQSIPSVAWVPLALLWFGISEAAVLFIVILEAFIPSALGVQNSINNIPVKLIQAGQSLGCSGYSLYKRVIIPAILPQLLSSLRLSWAFAWRALIAGELFVNGYGLGQTLELGRSLSDMSQVIAMIVIIAIVGYLTDNIFFKSLEKTLNYH
ncbi:MAG: ABC transporter permease [Candidatus Caenarcaniphilales bacterium]|nr:ABC transporter permease [Candidatus Caenarcaniphilales bacterium]